MGELPNHGRVNCTRCFPCSTVEFNTSRTGNSDWRITANPLAWGNPAAEIVILGFSKGPKQSGAVATAPHNEIAYKGARLKVGKILGHIGLLESQNEVDLRAEVDREISDPLGKFHFGSLIRCTVERFDKKANDWKGSGCGMLDRFIATEFGKQVAQNCTDRFLGHLDRQVKLVIMFGMGTKLNFVRATRRLFQTALPGTWSWINDVAYTNGVTTVVHVEHFASQGALIPNWLGENDHPRQELGLLARDAVRGVL